MTLALTNPRRPQTRGTSLAVTLLLIVTGTLAMTATATLAVRDTAAAACASTMEGTWRNIDPATRSTTRVDLTMRTCGDQTLCDAETGQCTRAETTYRLHGYGKCSPTDCDWGERVTTEMRNGWQRATYRYSWATKYVWVKTYQYRGRTYLRVRVRTDFTPTDGRQDYTSDEWMLR